MKYVIGTMDKKHYLWQVLVQINNFRKMGIEQDTHYVIGCFNENPSDELIKLVQSESLNCHITVYNDDRIDDTKKNYSSTLRLYLLERYFTDFPEMQEETFMYLDPDVIFTRPYDWSKFEEGDTWYVSNTASYLSSKYIKSKGEELFYKMCEIVGIEPELVEAQDRNCGGAQYIMKNVTPEFWEKCEIDSENLYNFMKATESKYNPQHPIQTWTADMWAVLWNALLFDRKVEVAEEMDFCWASDRMEKWDNKIIFHNAGVVGNGIIRGKKHFSKGLYQVSPFNQEIECDSENASFKYLTEVRETEKNFKDLVF